MKIISVLVIGYLLGSVSVAVLLSKGVFHMDVRKEGSGNAGATNVARVLGMKAGLLTLLGDTAKTSLAALVGWLLLGRTGLALGTMACLIGHCWPVFFDFRGGKGVSASACIALLYDWRMFLILVACFFLVFLLTRKVSLCSIISAALFPMLYPLLGNGIDVCFIGCCLVTVIVVFCHRENIRRLLRGEEKNFQPAKKK